MNYTGINLVEIADRSREVEHPSDVGDQVAAFMKVAVVMAEQGFYEMRYSGYLTEDAVVMLGRIHHMRVVAAGRDLWKAGW